MDWWRSSAGVAGLLVLPLCCAVLLLPLQSAQAWSLAATATPSSDSSWSPVVAGRASTVAGKASTTTSFGRQLNQISPYLDLALCPIRAEPWSCARQKSARVLDLWDDELHVQWQKLKVEADRQMNATIERRGYSASELPIKEKPSTLLKKIEIGTKYMKEYLAETMDGFLGREYEPLQAPKEASDDSENDADYDDDADTDAEPEGDGDGDAEEEGDAENDGETDAADSGDTGEDEEEENDGSNTGEQETNDDEEDEADEESDNENVPIVTSLNAVQAQPVDSVKNTVFNENNDNASGAVEFIELEDGEENATGAVKKPGHGGGGGKRKKNKTKRKKKGQQQQPATLVVVQQAPEHHEVEESVSHGHGHGGGGGGGHGGGHGGGIKKRRQKQKMKRGKRKRKGQHSQVQVDTETDDHLGLELLDDLVSSGIGGGGKRKHINYGRSNGVTRGKKKKKRKAFAKLALAGTLIKAKIELLLKILGAHLQIKFFAIALIGLLINIARFWIDVKRGGTPSKVVYVEHAHHQHHYEDHGEDWGEQGSYWKRSLQTDPSIEDSDSATDSYQLRQYAFQRESQQQPQDAHNLAYRNQYQWQ